MSAWPWMKDVGYALVDEPIEPVTEHDHRPAVVDLIEQHRSTIDKIRAGLSDDPLYDTAKHDDLWLLSPDLEIPRDYNAAKIGHA